MKLVNRRMKLFNSSKTIAMFLSFNIKIDKVLHVVPSTHTRDTLSHFSPMLYFYIPRNDTQVTKG